MSEQLQLSFAPRGLTFLRMERTRTIVAYVDGQTVAIGDERGCKGDCVYKVAGDPDPAPEIVAALEAEVMKWRSERVRAQIVKNIGAVKAAKLFREWDAD